MQKSGTEVIVLLVASSLLVLFLVIIIGSTIFISQKRKFRNRQKLIDIQTAYEQEILKTRLEIQTQTFETISRELHDNVGTILSMANVHMKTIPEMLDPLEQYKIKEAILLLNEAIDDLRDISHSLNPEWLDRMSMQEAIGKEMTRISNLHLLEVHIDMKGEEFIIPARDKIIIFRVVQEIVNNILHHAGAANLWMSMDFENGLMLIRIRDDGKGFDKHLVMKKDGIGLKNIFNRADMINAKVDLESTHGMGTTYSLSYMNKDL
jgi:two-component system, NarL family, sensor kinase